MMTALASDSSAYTPANEVHNEYILETARAMMGQAGEIFWSQPIDTTDKSQLLEGNIVLAINGGDTVTIQDGGPSGAQTYTFVGRNYSRIAFTPATSSKIYRNAGSASTGDANFDALINSFAYATSGIPNGVQQISGLTPGQAYNIQVFYNDQRTRFQGRQMIYGNGDDVAQNGQIQAGGSGWGQHAVGVFIAENTILDLMHMTSGFSNVHFTALLITEISESTANLSDEIIWSQPINTTDKSQLLDGNIVLAMNGGDAVTLQGGGPNGTQTYTFVGRDYSQIAFTPSTSSSLFRDAGSASTGDANFDALLNSFAHAADGISSGVQQISGLTPGQAYNIQVFYNDQREFGNDRLMTYGNSDDASQNVQIEASGSGWGQHAVGAFIAKNTTLDLMHTTNGFSNIHFTALLVAERSTVTANLITANLYGDTTTNKRLVEISLTFSEKISGLGASDLLVENGKVQSISGEGRYYSAVIEASMPGLIEVSVAPDSVMGINTLSTNTQSNKLSIEANFTPGDTWTIDEQATWLAANGQSTNITFQDGLAETENSGTFRSIVHSFPLLQQVESITFKQTSAWDSWTGISNVGPSEGRDAPVLLPLGNENYYFLALGDTGGYHAWHSTDMVNWAARGPVTPPGDGRWVTSAEYREGQTYIYSDAPNDMTPHLFIDDNLDDGIPGTAMGAAFVKPSCGSDASFFRNDTDGLFHIIYEDWSPINARQNSWDSPLAGHASSADGLTGFIHHEHLPPVDHRTTPTGVMNSYTHPEGNCSYEEHLPAQDAYGDWTTIKVGEQYYLFADYDQHDAGIRVARFTSDSIYKEFDLVGSLGNGHPDPTVGFAEGQFYLITQQATDYVSPGPWVDGVEARVGVDIDGDQTIDQWTNWQSVQEKYDHKAGYARVVEVTPAQVDVSELNLGYGFQFEFRLDNALVADVSPLIDQVELKFSSQKAIVNARSILGDVNCDNNADTLDALYLMQYVLGMRNSTDDCALSRSASHIYAPTGDVNNDGKINTIDALFVMQCDVGFNNFLCPAQ